MAAKPKRGGLGKGLEALFEVNTVEDDPEERVMLRISEIEPNKDQPRKHFDQAALSELAESISQHGVLSPLLVRPLAVGNYQLIAGERRWRASRMAGLSEVPVIIRELSDVEAAEISLIENLQREDLNPVEEALGYQSLIDDYGFTQEDVSKRVNKSRPSVANALRLLRLPKDVLVMLENGKIAQGHAKVLLGITDEQELHLFAEETVRGSLSVRELERRVKKSSEKEIVPDKPPSKLSQRGDSYYKEMELALVETLGRKVTVKPAKRGGTLTVEFFDKDDLRVLADKMSAEEKKR